jgi:hypothetical protein
MGGIKSGHVCYDPVRELLSSLVKTLKSRINKTAVLPVIFVWVQNMISYVLEMFENIASGTYFDLRRRK